MPSASSMDSTVDGDGRNQGLRPVSDDDIVRLAQYHHCQTALSLPHYILSPDSRTTLISYLWSRCSSPSSSTSVSEYVISLLSLISLSPSNPSVSSLLASLLLTYTQLFNTRKIPHDSHSLKTIQLFSALLSYVPAKDLESIVDSIVSALCNIECADDAQLLDLLPRCFDLLRTPGEIGEGNLDYVNTVFDTLIEVEWPKGMLVKMASLAKEFGFLDKARKSEFLEKLFLGMMAVDMQDLPSLVYQLLVLASKGFCKREVVEGIVKFFGSKKETKITSIFRQIEGTVLLHVNFAVKQDPSLGQEVISLMRSNFQSINHFAIAVLLSVARVRRFCESCLRALKAALITAYGDYEFTKYCKWLPDILKEEYLLRVKVAEESVLRAVNESSCGREHVLPSIIQFGFMLLESGKEGKHMEPYETDSLLGMEELTIQMLRILFEIHDMTRNEIIEQCKFRILSSKHEQSLLIIRVLESLVQNYPYLVLEYISHLKELLDYFTFMDGKVASRLVTALLPLIKFCGDLKDYTILVLRKAMFSRQDVVRIAATNAIIDLMVADKQTVRNGTFTLQDSSSQASCSQQAEMICTMRGGLFHELNGLLQRCLYQQAKIKAVVYNGLVKLVLMDPSIGGHVLDFLLPHFLRFYKESVDLQLNISSCIRTEGGKVFVEEPLDGLLSCISWILLLQPNSKTDRPCDSSWPCFGFSLSQENEEGRNLSHERLSSALKKIRNILPTKKLGDFLENSQEVMSASLEEEKKKNCASLLLGVVEVMLSSVATDMEKAADAERTDLIKKIVQYVDLHDLLEKDAEKSRHGSKRINLRSAFREVPCIIDSGNAKSMEEQDRLPCFTTSSICQLLQSVLELYNQECSSNLAASHSHSQSSLAKTVSSCSNIFSFVLDASLRHIRSDVGKENPLKRLSHGEIRLLGPPLLKLAYLLKPGSRSATTQKTKESKGKKGAADTRQYLELALLCLKDLISISIRDLTFTALIDDLLPVSTIEDDRMNDEFEDFSRINNPEVRSIEIFIAKILKPLLLELLMAPVCREIEVLCDTMLMLANRLPRERSDRHASWAAGICKSNGIKSSNAAKNVIRLVLSLSSPPDDLCLAEGMAKDLLRINSLEGINSVELSESFPIVNQSTSLAVTSCILQYVESAIADMDWATKKLRNLSLVSQKATCSDDVEERTSGLVFERTSYKRAESAVRVLCLFVQMTLKDPQAEQLLRLAARFYKHLAQMSKLRIASKGRKQLMPTVEYQKLVELTCKHLTAPLYNFVAELQRDRRENPTAKLTAHKIKRENKCIPELIFQIEDYEKYLIKLSKVTKINLLRHAKRSTSRDFKILDVANPVGQGDGGPTVASPQNHDSAGESETDDEAAEDGPEKLPSPECGTDLDGEDTERESGEDVGAPKSKRAKGSRVVSDSESVGDDAEDV